MHLSRYELHKYLEAREGAAVLIEEVRQLGEQAGGDQALDQMGKGVPLLVVYRCKGRRMRLVFQCMRRNRPGREREDDCMAAAWHDYITFNRVPGHVPALDLLIQTSQGKIQSIGAADKMLLVTAYSPGDTYAGDLQRIRDENRLQRQDVLRAKSLAGYLAKLHQDKRDDPTLWQRRLRDLVGDGEGIMGCCDGFAPGKPEGTESELQELENQANEWRWRLKALSHRLSRVHGDFQPGNVLFEEGVNFHLLDSRGGSWGDPADDVSCMAIHYILFSLQRWGWVEGPLLDLHDHFWAYYLDLSRDRELASVIQPWFAWRALALACPASGPQLEREVRCKLLRFAHNLLSTGEYEYRRVNQYLI